jgi:hypothetical protein
MPAMFRVEVALRLTSPATRSLACLYYSVPTTLVMQAVMLICRADTNIIFMLLMDAVIWWAWNLLKKQYIQGWLD